MKVVLLAPLPPPIGGIAEWTKRMLESDLKDGWELEVVDEKVIGGREVFGAKSKKRFFFEIIRCFRIWKDLIKALKDKDVRIVHSCIPSATLSMLRESVCALITKSFSRKFIIHFRCTVPNTTRSRIGKCVLKFLCNMSDRVVVLNAPSLNYLEDKINTNSVLIPNFVLCDEIAEQKNISDEIQSAVYVGGVIKEKGCIDLIEAAKSLLHIRFKLIGVPDDKVVEAASNVPNVELVGPLEHSDAIKELEKSDVFVFLTYYDGEGFSNALAEAMARGLPCIVTDWAANVDMIEDKGGVSVNIHSPSEVVKAFEALKDKSVRQAQSAFNIEKVRSSYSSANVLDLYVDLYNNIMGA